MCRAFAGAAVLPSRVPDAAGRRRWAGADLTADVRRTVRAGRRSRAHGSQDRQSRQRARAAHAHRLRVRTARQVGRGVADEAAERAVATTPHTRRTLPLSCRPAVRCAEAARAAVGSRARRGVRLRSRRQAAVLDAPASHARRAGQHQPVRRADAVDLLHEQALGRDLLRSTWLVAAVAVAAACARCAWCPRWVRRAARSVWRAWAARRHAAAVGARGGRRLRTSRRRPGWPGAGCRSYRRTACRCSRRSARWRPGRTADHRSDWRRRP